MKKIISLVILLSSIVIFSCNTHKKKTVKDEKDSRHIERVIIKTANKESVDKIVSSFKKCQLAFVKNISAPMNIYLFEFNKKICQSASLIEELKANEFVEMAEIDKELNMRN